MKNGMNTLGGGNNIDSLPVDNNENKNLEQNKEQDKKGVEFSKEDIAPEVREYYASMPKVYPDFKGGWQPHIVFIGEIIAVIDER